MKKLLEKENFMKVIKRVLRSKRKLGKLCLEIKKRH